jgi:glycosyltransferase involved in cell wall biosynthesis
MSLDIVFPAHNEEDRIDRTLKAYRSEFSQDDVSFHVALDGCRDGTAGVAQRHAREDGRIHVHDYPKLGKGGVLMETFRRCSGELIGFVDADCATPPSQFGQMVQAADDADGVIASRRLPASITPGNRTASRTITSVGFAWLVRHAFDLPYADTQCGAKVLRHDVVEKVIPLMSSRDFLFDVDLLVTARRVGFDLVEVPTIWIDQSGSKLDARRDALRMLAGTARLWIHHLTVPIDDGRQDSVAWSGSLTSDHLIDDPAALHEMGGDLCAPTA